MYEDFDDQFKEIHPLVNYSSRIDTINSIVDKVNELIPSNRRISNDIKYFGYTSLGQVLNNNQVKDIKEYLLTKLAYDSHVPPGTSGLNTIENIRRRKASACYPLQDILTCPHILETALNRDILGIAEDYLGCVPTIYSINAFHTFTGHPTEGIKVFHRDADDARFLCLFIYLVDVDDNTGPHVYIKYTHNELSFGNAVGNIDLRNQIFPPAMMTGHGNDVLFNEHLSEHMDTLMGPAGTGFFADTFGLHRGSNLTKDRMILWIRYGLHKNASAKDQTPEPLSKAILLGRNIQFDNKLNYITRVLLK